MVKWLKNGKNALKHQKQAKIIKMAKKRVFSQKMLKIGGVFLYKKELFGTHVRT